MDRYYGMQKDWPRIAIQIPEELKAAVEQEQFRRRIPSKNLTYVQLLEEALKARKARK